MVIIDTAGRLHVDEALMDEIAELAAASSPHEILFVADAMTGQDAVKSAEEFAQALPLTGVILTKLDGDARGGAALSIRAVARVPDPFVGVGEKPDDLELFHPERMAVAHPRHGRRPVADREGRARPRPAETERLAERIVSAASSLSRTCAISCVRCASSGPSSAVLEMLPKVGPLKRARRRRAWTRAA